MLFVKTSDLKEGMRLARPIYNKNGVLLYERNSKLTQQGISSVKTFGLLGIFILEPAEPVPPMTKDDIEFERFQTMNVFAIQEELTRIIQNGHAQKTQVIVSNIIKNYGHLDKKINLIQNLRSKEDFVYKHSLNVAILCAMMTHVLNMKVDEQLETVMSAVVHDVGKLRVSKTVMDKPQWDDTDWEVIHAAEIDGFDMIEKAFSTNPGVKRICMQAQKLQTDFEDDKQSDVRPVMGAKVLTVANLFDKMTAVQFGGEPASEVRAFKLLIDNADVFGTEIVDALTKSIQILAPGTSVELTTGEEGLVIKQNPEDILRPMLLTFHDNHIVDLGNTKVYGDIEIKDIMKTLDNRYIMNTAELRKNGFQIEEPEYVEAPAPEEN